MPMKRRFDIINQKYGTFFVKEFYGENKYGRSLYTCECDCGEVHYLTSGYILKKPTCPQIEAHIYQSRLEHLSEHIIRMFWKRIISNATRRNLDFLITPEYLEEILLEQNYKCYLTGETLTFPKSVTDYTHNASLDRVDNSKGYIKGNVMWCTIAVNLMKSDTSLDFFIELCNDITKYHANYEV